MHSENKKSCYYKKIDDMAAHVEQYISSVSRIVYDDNGENCIAVLIIAPTDKHNYYTLITCSGFWDQKFLSASKDYEATYEFIFCVNADWPLPMVENDLIESTVDWEEFPITLLVDIARFNLTKNLNLGYGHTLTAPVPFFPNIKSFMFSYPYQFPVDFSVLPLENPIFILGIYPLLEEEYQYALKHGGDELMDILSTARINLVFNPNRQSAFNSIVEN